MPSQWIYPCLSRLFIGKKLLIGIMFPSKSHPEYYWPLCLGGSPIGEVQLKEINHEQNECTLSIHMQNDEVKGKGYGTEAERLAIQYAFEDRIHSNRLKVNCYRA